MRWNNPNKSRLRDKSDTSMRRRYPGEKKVLSFPLDLPTKKYVLSISPS
jgi:hypothetical protein